MAATLPKRFTRALSVLLWPAFALLIITGFWNISTITFSGQSTAWKAVLIVKLVVVVVSGVGVYLYQRSTTKRASAAVGLGGRAGIGCSPGHGDIPRRMTAR